MSEDVTPQDLAWHEINQAAELGHPVDAFREQYRRLQQDGGGAEAYLRLLCEVEALEPPAWAREGEPLDLAQILATLPQPSGLPTVSPGRLPDQILGAWTGRVVGNMLGKPIEFGEHWTREVIADYLVSVDAYPLEDYVPVDPDSPVIEHFIDNWPQTTRGRVNGSSRDDDIDYTLLGLHVLETYGLDFTTADIAEQWLERLPFHQVYTAERAAYKNLVDGAAALEAALTSNPYREWIGALIRADVFGYVSPGDPRRAAELAYRDARLSHVGNGVYGEMWAAALVAAAFTAPSPRRAVAAALEQVPPHSRLHRELTAVVASFDEGQSWDSTLMAIEARHRDAHWIHTIANAAAIAAGVLWGEGDFTRTIALTVQAGMDTDSNGATAGSVAGIFTGAQGIPAHWVEPLHDTMRSALIGFDGSRISDLASRTLAIAER